MTEEERAAGGDTLRAAMRLVESDLEGLRNELDASRLQLDAARRAVGRIAERVADLAAKLSALDGAPASGPGRGTDAYSFGEQRSSAAPEVALFGLGSDLLPPPQASLLPPVLSWDTVEESPAEPSAPASSFRTDHPLPGRTSEPGLDEFLLGIEAEEPTSSASEGIADALSMPGQPVSAARGPASPDPVMTTPEDAPSIDDNDLMSLLGISSPAEQGEPGSGNEEVSSARDATAPVAAGAAVPSDEELMALLGRVGASASVPASAPSPAPPAAAPVAADDAASFSRSDASEREPGADSSPLEARATEDRSQQASDRGRVDFSMDELEHLLGSVRR